MGEFNTTPPRPNWEEMKSTPVSNLVGIVPIAGQALDFNFEWPDCMMPVAANYTMIESAVIECAYAGCKSIWVVCNDDISPLIRYRLGDFVEDPVYQYRYAAPNRHLQRRRQIPIYYVPIHPKDRDRLDSLGWSVIHGALRAWQTLLMISRWFTPSRYYVAFPYGMYDPKIIREHRKYLPSHDPEKGFFLTHEGKTVRDGLYLGFTFSPEDWLEFRRSVRKQGTREWINSGAPGNIPTEKLPFEERWSARYFSLDKIFGCAKIDNAKTIELNWYHEVDNWDGYRKYLGSPEADKVKRPDKLLPRGTLTILGGYKRNGNKEEDDK